LTRLNLGDLLDAEMKRLQQLQPNVRQPTTISGSRRSSPSVIGSQNTLSMSQQRKHQTANGSERSSPSIIGSHTPQALSQLTSTPLPSHYTSTSLLASQPFELPDVNISDLLNATMQSLNDVRTSSLAISPALSALSSADHGSRKKPGKRKNKDSNENCHGNGSRKTSRNSTAPSDKESLRDSNNAAGGKELLARKTLAEHSSQGHSGIISSGRCSLGLDDNSDDKFQGSWSSSGKNALEKCGQNMQRDGQMKADRTSATAAAGEVTANGICDESRTGLEVSGVVTNDAACKTVSNGSDVYCLQFSANNQMKADCTTAAAEAVISSSTNDELHSKLEVLGTVRNVTDSPVPHNSQSGSSQRVTINSSNSGGVSPLQSIVAQRLSKFAFSDKLLQRCQQTRSTSSSPSGPVTHVSSQAQAVSDQTAGARHATGNYDYEIFTLSINVMAREGRGQLPLNFV